MNIINRFIIGAIYLIILLGLVFADVESVAARKVGEMDGAAVINAILDNVDNVRYANPIKNNAALTANLVNAVSQDPSEISELTRSPVFSKISGALKDIFSVFLAGIDALASGFNDLRQLIVGKISGSGDSNENPEKSEGVIVFSGTGDIDEDRATIARLKDLFSDETVIIPDAGGESGVIQPVFRDSTDDNYLYLVVPLK